MHLGDYELGRDEPGAVTNTRFEQCIGVVVSPIVGAEQGNQGAAIDEDARWRHDRIARRVSAT
jgi:hypothetical protein